MTKTSALLVGLVGIAALETGCLAVNSQGYPVGFFYSGVKAPHTIDRAEISGPAKTGDKKGEACATGILGLAAFGDASVDAAKKAGGITEVHSVEYGSQNIVGLVYVQACTIVHGK